VMEYLTGTWGLRDWTKEQIQSQNLVTYGPHHDIFNLRVENAGLVAAKFMRGHANHYAVEVRVKIASLSSDADDAKKKTARELDTWSKLRHANVLEFFGVAKFHDHVAMISPWMENGNVTLFLQNHSDFDRYKFVCVLFSANANGSLMYSTL
jgi:serine/threonine protein kinase